MNILITGGSGFIGSHLVDYYAKDPDNKIIVIDDFSTGDIGNLRQHKRNNKVVVFDQCILYGDVLNASIRNSDVVFHLAASVGVKNIMEHPLYSLENNIEGTRRVLEYCNKYNKKVVIASSSEVYGKASKMPLSEKDDVTYGSSDKIRWSYSASKLIDEFLALSYFIEHDLNVAIVRFFNVVGERQTDAYGMVIPTFIRQAKATKPIVIYGDGKQTRTFTYVKDVVWALKELVKRDDVWGEIFNVGGDFEISINALAEVIKELTKSASIINHESYKYVFGDRFEDMPRRVPDLTKINKFIGYEPKTSLGKILDILI